MEKLELMIVANVELEKRCDKASVNGNAFCYNLFQKKEIVFVILDMIPSIMSQDVCYHNLMI